MATKAELEEQVASLEKALAKAENKVAPLPDPSPVNRGQLYVESHPTLGITKSAHVVRQSIGDGRIGDGAEIVRS